MSHKSRLGSSCNSQCKTGAQSKNPVVHRVQTTLAGENLVAKDSDSFGHEFPTGIDMNEDVQNGKLAKRLKELRLKDLIISNYPSASPSATFNRNNSQTPVDSIWGNSSLEVISAGCGPFDGDYPSAL